MTETAIMQLIKEDIGKTDRAIYIDPAKGCLLKIFANLLHASIIVEIGTLYGYSTLWLQQGLVKNGILHTIEKDPQRFAKASQYLEDYGDIVLHKGAALNVLPTITGPVDLIFIDADKKQLSSLSRLGCRKFKTWRDSYCG